MQQFLKRNNGVYSDNQLHPLSSSTPRIHVLLHYLLLLLISSITASNTTHVRCTTSTSSTTSCLVLGAWMMNIPTSHISRSMVKFSSMIPH